MITIPKPSRGSEIIRNPTLALLYYYLLAVCDDDGIVREKVKQIAVDLSLGERQVRYLLKRLELSGILSRNFVGSFVGKLSLIALCNTKSYKGGVSGSFVGSLSQDFVGSLSQKKTTKKATKSTQFQPPTQQEIDDYVFAKNYHFDPSSFIPFYQSKGWKVGNAKMKDWRAACHTWESRWKEKHGEKYYYELTPNNNSDERANRAQSRQRLRDLSATIVQQSANNLISLYADCVKDTDAGKDKE